VQIASPTAPGQLTDRAPAPPTIPNGPFSSPPADPADARARRPIEAELPHDRSAVWLRNAAIGLCALAAAAASVSFTAQYWMVYADRRLAAMAGMEAAIPDAAALVFACLGIALALHGRRALRARALNVASVGASVFMNAIAAAPGWRSLAVWAMPPVAYALASDTLIGVIRSWVIARHQHLNVSLAADEVTPLAVVGGLVLWLLRLSLGAPVDARRIPRLGAGPQVNPGHRDRLRPRDRARDPRGSDRNGRHLRR
jgi:hypothetical protein